MNIQETLQQVPDSAKLSVALSSTALTFMGISVEQWMYLLSGIVSLLFIIEKSISLYHKYKEYRRSKKNASCE